MKVVLVFIFLVFQKSVYSQVDKMTLPETTLDSILKQQSDLIGKKFGEFIAKDLKNVKVSHSQLNGKVTLINFWFSTCTPCIAEFPALIAVNNKFKRNNKFQMLAITFESKKTARSITKKHNLNFRVLLTSYDSCNNLNYHLGYPVTLLVDSSGDIVYAKIASSTDPVSIKHWAELELKPAIERELSKL